MRIGMSIGLRRGLNVRIGNGLIKICLTIHYYISYYYQNEI